MGPLKGGINSLRDRVARNLIEYAKNPDYVPTLLATNCIRFMPLDNSLSKASHHLGAPSKEGEKPIPDGDNYLIANYGAMSQIVNRLYLEADNIYNAYKKDNDIQIVYFTTLSMRIDKYLAPKEWTKDLPSVVAQWDITRDLTRRSVHHNEQGGPGRGHMWKFANQSDKFEFNRVCLCLKDDEVLTSNENPPISTETVWRNAFINDTKELIVKVYDAARTAIDQWEKLSHKEVKLIDRIRYASHPQFIDRLEIDSLSQIDPVEETDAALCGTTLGSIFKDLYHPNGTSAKKYILSLSTIKDLFYKEKSKQIPTCFDDDTWVLLQQILNGRRNDLKWHEFFFNRLVPLDLFAIGIKNKGESTVEWKGCLGAYIGGDFNQMLLSWHDDIIEKSNYDYYKERGKPWTVIKHFVNLLYENAEPLPSQDVGDSNSRLAISDDLTLYENIDTEDTEFTKSYKDFMYGLGPSIAAEEIIKLLNDGCAPREGAILEIGGAYGRDAFYLADYIKSNHEREDEIYVLDKHSGWSDEINNIKTYYPNISNVHFLNGDFIDIPISDWACEGSPSLAATMRFTLIYSYKVLHLFNKEKLKVILSNCLKYLKVGGVMYHVFPSNCDLFTKSNEGSTWTTSYGTIESCYGLSKEKLEEIVFDVSGVRLTPMDKNKYLKCGYIVELHRINDSMLNPIIDNEPKHPTRNTSLPYIHRHIMWMLYFKRL
ncbi:MAG: class I SAM-dependent methyltransferase [Geobacteraceae bacterium]